jgi:hypothetical protein
MKKRLVARSHATCPTIAPSEGAFGSAARAPDRPTGLFAELLGDALEPLADDMQRVPERYDEAARALADRLLAEPPPARRIADGERRVLDEATWRFATAPRPGARDATALPPKTRVVVEPRAVAMDRELDSYWWLDAKSRSQRERS